MRARVVKRVPGEKPEETAPQAAGYLNGRDSGPPLEGTVEVALFVGKRRLRCALRRFANEEMAS